MSLEYKVGQNYGARCTFHPLGTIYNWKQRAEAFQDGDKTSRKVNQKEKNNNNNDNFFKLLYEYVYYIE